jgi:hypothetical protein
MAFLFLMEFITKIKSLFPDWKQRFEFFSQEGGGEIRRYSIPEKKSSSETKRLQADFEKILKRKKMDDSQPK